MNLSLLHNSQHNYISHTASESSCTLIAKPNDALALVMHPKLISGLNKEKHRKGFTHIGGEAGSTGSEATLAICNIWPLLISKLLPGQSTIVSS